MQNETNNDKPPKTAVSSASAWGMKESRRGRSKTELLLMPQAAQTQRRSESESKK